MCQNPDKKNSINLIRSLLEIVDPSFDLSEAAGDDIRTITIQRAANNNKVTIRGLTNSQDLIHLIWRNETTLEISGMTRGKKGVSLAALIKLILYRHREVFGPQRAVKNNPNSENCTDEKRRFEKFRVAIDTLKKISCREDLNEFLLSEMESSNKVRGARVFLLKVFNRRCSVDRNLDWFEEKWISWERSSSSVEPKIYEIMSFLNNEVYVNENNYRDFTYEPLTYIKLTTESHYVYISGMIFRSVSRNICQSSRLNNACPME